MISNSYITKHKLLAFCLYKCVTFVLVIFFIPQIICAQNLILNGSAENATAGKLDNWTEVIGPEWRQGNNFGAGDQGTVPPQDGAYLFFAYKSPTVFGEWAELSQSIDLTSYSSLIDAGIQSFEFKGYTRSWQSATPSQDEAQIIIEFYDGSNNIINNWSSGIFASLGTSNNSNDGWEYINQTLQAPFGARSVLIRLRSKRNSGEANDAYFDNLSLEAVCTAGTASLTTITICEGDSTTLTLDAYTGDLQWQKSIDNGTNWSNLGLANNVSTIKVSSTFANSPTLYRAEVTSLFCTEYSSSSSLIINETPVIGALTADKTTLCEGEPVSLNLASGNGVYTWEQSNSGGSFNGFGNTNNTQTETPTLLNSPVDYRVISTIGSCTDTSNEVQIIIETAPVGGTTNASQPTICEGESSSLNLTLASGNIQWQDSVSGGTWTNFGNNNSTETVSPLNSNSPTFYRAELTTGSCTDYSSISSITINEKPSAGVSSTSKNSLCSGESTTISLASYTGTIQWQDSISGGSWSNIGTGVTSFSPTSSPANSPASYRAITAIGTCYDTSNISTVTVFPSAVGGSPLTPTTSICEGEATTITLSNSSGVIQWQEKVNGGTWTNFGTGNANELINPSATNSPIEYRALLTAGSCSDISSTYTLTVNPPAVAGTNSISSTSLCDGNTEQITLTGETGSIQWQRQINGGSWNDFGTTANVQAINPTSTDVTVSYRAQTTLGTCSSTSNTTTINIYSSPSRGFASAPISTLCDGESTLLTLVGSNGDIQWQQKTSSGSWINFGGFTATESITPSITDSPITYRAMLTTGVCIDSSSEYTINVSPSPVAGTSSSLSNSLCEGESTTLSVNGNSGSIQWQDSISGGLWSDLGITSTSFQTNTSYTYSTIYFRSIATTGSCYDTSNFTTITINPSPVAGIASLSSSTICEGDSSKLELSGNTGTPKWEVSLNNVLWFDAPPSSTDSITSLASLSPTYIRSTSTSGTCTDISDVIQLTIVPPPTTGTINLSDTLCHNEDASVSIIGNSSPVQWQQSINGNPYINFGSGNTSETINHTANQNPVLYKAIVSNGTCERFVISSPTTVVEPVGGNVSLSDFSICDGSSTTLSLSGQTGTSIQWQRAINGGSYSNFGGNTSSLLVSPSLTDVSVEYQAIVYLGTTCNATSSSETLTISQPAVAGNLSIADDTICNGSSSLLNLTNSLGTINWEFTTDTTNWTTIGPGTSTESITPNFNNSPTYYRAIVENGNCSDTTTIDSLFIAVVKGGTISNPDLTICSGNNTTLTLTGEIGTIQWQQVLANGTSIDLPSTTNSISVSPTTVNSPAQYRASVKQANCTDFSNILTITIDTVPASIPTIIGNDTICGTDLASFSIAPLANATSYVWASNTGSIITNGNSQTDVTLINNDNPNAQITIFGNNSCGDGIPTSFDYVILATPAPTITTPDSVICKDQSLELFVSELNGIAPSQLDYVWFINGTAIPNSNSSSITQQAEGSYTVSIENSNNCLTSSDNSTLISIFEMEVDAGNDKSILQGDATTLEASSSGNFTYEWMPNFFIDNNTTLTPLVSPTENTTYTITATSDKGCIDTSSTTVYVNQKITIPNAFSPNGDGINDEWIIENINQWSPVQVSIFNRWGGLLYETYKEYTPWDGKRNGASLPVGTYYFIIKVSDDEVYTGGLTITR